MTNHRRGPSVLIRTSCAGCAHLEVVSYVAMGEHCAADYCTVLGARRALPLVGGTPTWCPYLLDAVRAECERAGPARE